MTRQLLMLGLLAAVLGIPAAHAQAVAASAPAPVLSPIDPAAVEALQVMGATLQSLKRFQVMTELTGERVLADGQKLQHSARAEMDVARPDRLRVRMFSARAERELFFDGKTVTLYTPAQQHYSTVELTDTLSGLVEKLQQKFGVDVPLSDLFVWGTAGAPIDKIESAMNAGQDYVGTVLCDHYAFRQGTIDWQIWISTGAKPLPRKLVITNRADEARPQSVHLIEWNVSPTFKDAIFTFKPPKGATAVQIVPLKTQ